MRSRYGIALYGGERSWLMQTVLIVLLCMSTGRRWAFAPASVLWDDQYRGECAALHESDLQPYLRSASGGSAARNGGEGVHVLHTGETEYRGGEEDLSGWSVAGDGGVDWPGDSASCSGEQCPANPPPHIGPLSHTLSRSFTLLACVMPFSSKQTEVNEFYFVTAINLLLKIR